MKLTNMQRKIVEFWSWYGVIAIIVAYIIVSFEIMQPNSFLPVFLNISGSAGVLVDAWKSKNWQPVVINVVWILVAILTIFR